MKTINDTKFRLYEPADKEAVLSLGSALLDSTLNSVIGKGEVLQGALLYTGETLIGAALCTPNSNTGLSCNFVVFVHPAYRLKGAGRSLTEFVQTTHRLDSSRAWRYLMTSMNFPWDEHLDFLKKVGFELASCPSAHNEKMAVLEL